MVSRDYSIIFHRALILTFSASLAIVAGVLTSVAPLAGAGLAGFGIVAGLVTLGSRVERLLLISLCGLLLGYMLQGRGFAYFGIPPLYVGEIVLGLGLFTLLFARISKRMSYLQVVLIGFMLLGIFRTIPYIDTYGIDSIRDAALWYYGLYAIIVSLLLSPERLNILIQNFGRVLPFLAVWMALMSVFFRFLPSSLPHFPGSPLPIISVMKANDRSIVLVAIAAFVLTGLYERFGPHRPFPQTLFWLCWLVSAVLVFSQNRGGLLSILMALLLVGVLIPSRQWLKAAFVGSAALLLLIILDPTIGTEGGRTISLGQLTTNVMSIFSDVTQDTGSVQGTKEWRLNWWEDIWNYTVRGEHFWDGKGFGINLANDDGYQVTRDESLRSPHSSHMTVLARMGVPGMLLWIALQLGFAVQMILSIIKSRTRRQDDLVRIKAWLLAMWLAAMVSSSFDVYLEGPQGAIVFWSVFGASIAAMRMDSAPAVATEGLSAIRTEGEMGANPACA